MKLTLQNFIGIGDASIEIADGITLVAGGNGAGKSSLLRAAAACATNSIIPVILPSGKEAVLRGQSKTMVRTGEKKGTAILSDGDQEITLTWPANTSKGTSPINTTKMSTGLMEWMMLPPDVRRQVMTTAMTAGGLSVEPGLEDLAKAMESAGIGDQKFVDYVWGLIKKSGWDDALANISNNWSEVTGLWRATTGEAYGAEKAKDWYPRGWDPALKSASEDDLKSYISTAKTALEDGIARRAVGGAHIESLRVEAGKPIIDITADENKVSDLERLLDAVVSGAKTETGEIADVRGRLRQVEDGLSKINRKAEQLAKETVVGPVIPKMPGESNRNGQCPSCGAGLYITNKAGLPFVEPETKTTLEIMQKAQVEIAKAKEHADKCFAINSNIEKQKAELRVQLGHGLIAQKDLTDKLAVLSRAAQQESNATIKNLTAEITDLKSMIASNKKANQSIRDAIEQIRKIDSQASGGNAVTDETIAKLRADVDRHTQRLDASKTKTTADNAAARAARLAIVKGILAQDGLRANKLRSTMDRVAVMIDNCCRTAVWTEITTDADLNLFMGGRPFALLSKSEQYRCNLVMQLVLAKLDGSELLIFDGADILDSCGRMALIRLIREMDARSLVAMTAKRDYAEMVSKRFDAVFWVNNGTVESI